MATQSRASSEPRHEPGREPKLPKKPASSLAERWTTLDGLDLFFRESQDPPDAPVMIYACGPEGMLAATAATAARFGQPCEVSVERIMGCGLGGCYSCVVPMLGDDGRFHHVRSCLAGPVLAADQIRWG